MRGQFILLLALLEVSATTASEADAALSTIKSVKREGAGNEQAAAAWKALVKQGPDAVPAILAAFDGADATVANWLRSAIDAIAEREQADGRKLDAGKLEMFLKDTKRDPRARAFALELLAQADPEARARLLPGLLDDPSAGVRREAVAHAVKFADLLGSNADDRRRAEFQKLFKAARDVDQVEAIAKKIKELGGAEPDVIAHMGLITRWELAGPFDNSALKGFAATPPKVEAWKEFATGHPRAQVELYQAFGTAKGLKKDGKKDAVYALCRTEFDSPGERSAEIRLATQNAVKVYCNGGEVFSRDEYHHNQKLDQHIARVRLKKGRNEIVVKICQDDMTPDWTFAWEFQCRMCDEIGGAIPLKVLTAPNAVPVKPLPPKEKK